jgi:NADH-quinone oxidoreductase subunit F
MLDIPVDYDRLAEAGSMMGSGGMVIMDETDCMVDCAKYFLDFLKDESCGKCTPCREGIRGLLEILTRITEGKGRDGDLELLEELGSFIIDSALCALGGSAPNPVMSTLKHFRDEYVAHIRDKKCPAGVCKALVTYSIDSAKCNGCHLCAGACPSNCISGAPKEVHRLDAANCVKCTACFEVCRQNAILRT